MNIHYIKRGRTSCCHEICQRVSAGSCEGTITPRCGETKRRCMYRCCRINGFDRGVNVVLDLNQLSHSSAPEVRASGLVPPFVVFDSSVVTCLYRTDEVNHVLIAGGWQAGKGSTYRTGSAGSPGRG